MCVWERERGIPLKGKGKQDKGSWERERETIVSKIGGYYNWYIISQKTHTH